MLELWSWWDLRVRLLADHSGSSRAVPAGQGGEGFGTLMGEDLSSSCCQGCKLAFKIGEAFLKERPAYNTFWLQIFPLCHEYTCLWVFLPLPLEMKPELANLS